MPADLPAPTAQIDGNRLTLIASGADRLRAIIALIDEMLTQVPVDAPWTAAEAEAWDSQTLDTWLREHTVSPQTREVASAAFNALFGGEAREISLLYALWYVACAGDEKSTASPSSRIDPPSMG